MKFLTTFILLISLSLSYADLDDGLVAYYPFDGNADDESGYENGGTVFGPSLISDRFGNSNSAYYFDGIDDYIDVNNYTLSIRENISIFVWVKNLDFTFSDGQGNFIITKGRHYVDPCDDYVLANDPNNRYYFDVTINNNGHQVYTDPVLDDSFHLLTGIYDYDNSILKIYLDGNLEDSLPVTGLIDDTNDEFIIGDWDGNSIWHFFEGTIDDIRIYDRVLSEDEIDELFTQGGWLNEPENPSIQISAGNVNLSWSSVAGAASYKIYSSDDPYEPVENWTFEANVFDTNWSETIPIDEKKFYYVTASN